jgi:hypothetical protein
MQYISRVHAALQSATQLLLLLLLLSQQQHSRCWCY